jgi:hypothetical protein
MIELATASPISARVIERRQDGSARIEVPVVTVTPKIDLAKTEGGGKGTIAITADDLLQMVQNFGEWTKPVAVGFDGFDGHQDTRNGPQSVFVDALRVDGDALLAVMDMNRVMAPLVLEDRAYRGFSMEAIRNPKTPTRSFRGWVLTGGVFTNNPATDTQFKIAATGQTEADEVIQINSELVQAPTGPQETKKMADESKDQVSLTFHESKLGEVRDQLAAKTTESDTLRSKLTAAEERIATLEKSEGENRSEHTAPTDKVASLTAKSNRLEAELTAANDAKSELAKALTEKTAQHAELESKTLGVEVKAVILSAIDNGIPPAMFEGWEPNPADWLKANFASIESLKKQVAALAAAPEIPKGSVQKSGHDPAASDPDGPSEEVTAELERIGIDTSVNFVGVTTEEEARKRIKASRQD